jgi:hypothetical protein
MFSLLVSVCGTITSIVTDSQVCDEIRTQVSSPVTLQSRKLSPCSSRNAQEMPAPQPLDFSCLSTFLAPNAHTVCDSLIFL